MKGYVYDSNGTIHRKHPKPRGKSRVKAAKRIRRMLRYGIALRNIPSTVRDRAEGRA